MSSCQVNLDFRRSIEAHCIDSLEQVGLEVELFEAFHRVERAVGVLALDLEVVLVLHQALPDHLKVYFRETFDKIYCCTF